jgi:hypothetical protein
MMNQSDEHGSGSSLNNHHSSLRLQALAFNAALPLSFSSNEKPTWMRKGFD